ncbi:MAG: hypothetical protein GYA33_11455 [Thermogutta sp.]|nr:hypothetical protein [Thermogutta sp.]
MASDLPGGRGGAGILCRRPNIEWKKDRGKEPERPKAGYPWFRGRHEKRFWGRDEKTADFAGGGKFDGNRWNACDDTNRWNAWHYTTKTKQAARDAAGKGMP